MTSRAWHIELAASRVPQRLYFAGLLPCYGERKHQIVLANWSLDRTEAIQFARARDALTMARSCGIDEVSVITEVAATERS